MVQMQWDFHNTRVGSFSYDEVIICNKCKKAFEVKLYTGNEIKWGEDMYSQGKYNYCPNCGAKLE